MAVTGQQYCGALVGHSDGGSIEACASSGSINSGAFTGGLVGYLSYNLTSINKSNKSV